MRIPCPFCGDRAHAEFAYLGDATVKRPEGEGADIGGRTVAAVYFRENPAGPLTELWYHRGGCRSWLNVTRDTRTHAILTVSMTRDADA
jgi:sarcosine oxidase subunit delta